MSKTDKTVDILAEYIANWEAMAHRTKISCGIRQAQERGVVFGNGNILGYDKVDGKYVVNQEQAKTVRMIFDLYLNGHSAHKIKDILKDKGRITSLGHTTWHTPTIFSVLRNPFYCGKVRYLNPTRVEAGSHEPIITEDVFNATSELLQSRKYCPVRP